MQVLLFSQPCEVHNGPLDRNDESECEEHSSSRVETEDLDRRKRRDRSDGEGKYIRQRCDGDGDGGVGVRLRHPVFDVPKETGRSPGGQHHEKVVYADT